MGDVEDCMKGKRNYLVKKAVERDGDREFVVWGGEVREGGIDG